jgi:hypothetical protein
MKKCKNVELTMSNYTDCRRFHTQLGSKCYYLSYPMERRNWMDAMNDCRQRKEYLWQPVNAEEQVIYQNK